MGNLLRIGDLVVALREIKQPVTVTAPGRPSRTFARPGDMGTVVGLGTWGMPTIRWHSGKRVSVTDCEQDVEFVMLRAHDVTVGVPARC